MSLNAKCTCSEGSARGAPSKKGSKAKPKDVQAERVQQRKSRKREKASSFLPLVLLYRPPPSTCIHASARMHPVARS